MHFTELQLSAPIQKALAGYGYTQATPIQTKTIPEILAGKDVCGIAQTGTGKTGAFAIPLIDRLAQQIENMGGQKSIQALILVPTRELAVQVADNITQYAKYTTIRHTVIYGGVDQRPQVTKLQKGVDVLIATPGRLLDLHDQGVMDLNRVAHVVLDEADRMLDMGFLNDVKKIMQLLPRKRQTLLFSATMPAGIKMLAQQFLNDPVRFDITPPSKTADKVDQHLYLVIKDEKIPLLIHLLADRSFATVLVFTKTKHGADKVTKHLNKAGIGAEAIHGDKTQSARLRALDNFKKWKTRVLVATDVAARGLDIPELSHVINFDIPRDAETYVHRIGRTGRAGASGVALSFCDYGEMDYVKGIQKHLGRNLPIEYAHPFHAETYGDELHMSFVGEKGSSQKKMFKGKSGSTQKSRFGVGRKGPGPRGESSWKGKSSRTGKNTAKPYFAAPTPGKSKGKPYFASQSKKGKVYAPDFFDEHVEKRSTKRGGKVQKPMGFKKPGGKKVMQKPQTPERSNRVWGKR